MRFLFCHDINTLFSRCMCYIMSNERVDILISDELKNLRNKPKVIYFHT
jgi:hypothetical protein